jgi:hypothetical protein
MNKTELTVLRDDVEWSTRFDGKISEVEIDGRKINDVHDLTEKVINMTKTIRVLAFTATALAIMAVGTVFFMAQWLVSHEASIEQLLLTGNEEYNQMRTDSLAWNTHKRERAWVHLKEFHGLRWDDRVQDWIYAKEGKEPLEVSKENLESKRDTYRFDRFGQGG